MRILGIDPGTSTGFVVLDTTILYAGTIKKDAQPDPDWAKTCSDHALRLVEEFSPDRVGLELFVPPHVYYQGKKQLIHPATIVTPAIVFGGVFCALETHGIHTYIVYPKHNGSGANYPKELQGRKPKGLGPSTGTRQHERSAYDIAWKTGLMP